MTVTGKVLLPPRIKKKPSTLARLKVSHDFAINVAGEIDIDSGWLVDHQTLQV